MQKYVGKKFYRFGVLEGNHAEDRFGLDRVETIHNPPLSDHTEQKDKYPIQSTLYNTSNYDLIDKNKYPKRSYSVKLTDTMRNQSTLTKEYYETKEKLNIIEENPKLNINNELQKSLALNMRGEPAHIVFGHGLKEDQFQRREFSTTYDLTINTKLEPKTFLNSKFDVNTMSLTTTPAVRATSRSFVGQLTLSKSHHSLIPPIGDKSVLNTKEHPFKSYDEYTKSFDSTFKKTGLRK